MSRVFDELARKAITRNFLDGIPYETVAEELGVSRDTIYNKIKKYSPKIFKGLK
jgi:transposase